MDLERGESMTWKEFKEQVEEKGVKDEDAINSIDLSDSFTGDFDIMCTMDSRTGELGWIIYG